jgi:SHS2 domain-containing protein
MMRFEIIEHPADVGFYAYGTTLPLLFENAALALCSLACAPETVAESVKNEVVATATTIDSLLYDWLAEILAIADAEQLVFHRVQVIDFREPSDAVSGEVRGIAYGEAFDRDRHIAGTYIKAVTLHQFALDRISTGYRARVFLDL